MLVVVFLVFSPAGALVSGVHQVPPETAQAAYARIRDEGVSRSKVMDYATEHVLIQADVSVLAKDGRPVRAADSLGFRGHRKREATTRRLLGGRGHAPPRLRQRSG